MPCDDKGFTLLELILVMLIVSFSLVALAPALEQVIARQRLENSAEMMGWVLRSAQQKAIYSGQS